MSLKLSKLIMLVSQVPRWGKYKEIIAYALKKDYAVTSMIDWHVNYKDLDQKVLIMRHDVDCSIKGATKMYYIEKGMGVHSTFYFRWSTVDERLIKDIREYGSEVGLHYETLANYAERNNIFRREEIKKRDISKCQNELKEEIKKFNKLFGKIRSVASHGAERNRLLGMPNNMLLENVNLKEFRLELEAYNKEILKLFSIYISDGYGGDFYWRYGT